MEGENIHMEELYQGKGCISKVGNQRKYARLCARGYEEEQNFRTGSSTCFRGVNPTWLIVASKRWALKLLDINILFLQGNTIKRTAFARPSKEANTNKIWKLQHGYVPLQIQTDSKFSVNLSIRFFWNYT